MMRKFVYICLMVSVMASMSFALSASDPYAIPEDLNGNLPGSIDLVGAKYSFFADAAAVSNIISTYPVTIFGVMLGLAPVASGTTSYLVLFDSAPYGSTYTGAGDGTTYKITPTLYTSTSTTNSVLNTVERPVTEYWFQTPINTTRGLVARTDARNQEYTVIWRYRLKTIYTP